MTVYSTLLFTGLLPVGTGTLYTVPSGYVAVVRDIEVWSGATSQAGINFGLLSSGFYAVIWNLEIQPSAWQQWKGRVVAPAGLELQGYGGGQSTIHACVSGYLLSLSP
jgi:hypothetical protein